MKSTKQYIIIVAVLIVLGAVIYFSRTQTDEVPQPTPSASASVAAVDQKERMTQPAVQAPSTPKSVGFFAGLKNLVQKKIETIPSQPVPAISPTATTTAPTPVVVKKQCYQASFRVLAKTVQARELLMLPEGKINFKSVCVRVNGVPVRHQVRNEKTNELLIQSLPDSVDSIVVQYCDPQIQCQTPCEVKQDEFLNALSGGEENLDSDPMEMAQGWEGGDGDLDSEEKNFKNEVKNFNNEISGANSGRSQDQLSSRWKVSENTIWCDSSLKAVR